MASSIFLFGDDDEGKNKINIDGLYEKKQKRDLKQISIFNKILNRVHKRIEFTAKSKNVNDTHIWYLVPEYIVGEPIYNKGECIGYIVTELESNGFHVKYIYPNTLFISWHNHVPSYVRNEIKKKTGLILDEKGNILDKEETIKNEQTNKLIDDKNNEKSNKQYVSTKEYKPIGNLLYDQDLLDKLNKRLG